MKKSNILFSIVFLGIIFGFFFVDIFTPDILFSYSENRNLQQKPKLTWETILDSSFMNDMEVYVNDQIKFRDEFVKLSTYTNLLLGQKEVNGVYICDDYLIETFKENDIDYEMFGKNIEYVKVFLETYDNSYISIIPTATEILGHKVPKYSSNVNQALLINEIYRENKNIDIYSYLMNHREEEIFYKTDHHWTTLGAYYGYLAICNKLNLNPMELSEFEISIIDDNFSGTIQSKVNIQWGYDILYRYTPKDLSVSYSCILNEDYNHIKNTLYDESKLNTKEKYAVYIGGNNAVTRIFTENGKEDKGRLLLIKDSFSHCLVPFLANHYSEVVLVDLRYFNLGVNTFLKNEKEFDDIIILYNLKNFIEDKNLIKINK